MNPKKSRPVVNIRPSYLLLLSALPFIIYLFLQVEDYQRVLKFVASGIGVTLAATTIAYISASVLGLILVALLAKKLSNNALIIFFSITLCCLLASAFFLSRPKVGYTLIGSPEGNVAILNGTPKHLRDSIKNGDYAEDAQERKFRSIPDVEAALDRLETGRVGAAFLPHDAVPHDATILWQVSFLPEKTQRNGFSLLVLGIFIGLLTFSGWWTQQHPLVVFSELYIDTIRGIPMLVIILYVGFMLQSTVRELSGDVISLPKLTRGIMAISLGYAAYMAEIFRAGIEAIPQGQIEAARSLGLSRWQTTRYIILPQALRVVIAPLGNELIAMLKDTSLLSVLAIKDITQLAKEYQTNTLRIFEAFNTISLLYIGFTLAASSMFKWLERRTTIQDKR